MPATDAPRRGPLYRIAASQFARFLVVGAVAAVINFSSRILISHWTGYAVAVTLAFCIGMAAAFVLNRMFVFKESALAVQQQAAGFVAVNLVGMLQTVAISVVLARYVFPHAGFHWYADEVAHVIGIVVPIVSSYFGHKHFSFRR